jgi:hypothetical protein
MAKNTEYRTQVYDLGEDATVTIRYHKDRRPKMVHNDRYAIIGEAPEQVHVAVGTAAQSPALPMTNRALDPALESQFAAIQAEGRKRRSAAEIAASGPGAGGEFTPEEVEDMTRGIERAALMSIPS